MSILPVVALAAFILSVIVLIIFLRHRKMYRVHKAVRRVLSYEFQSTEKIYLEIARSDHRIPFAAVAGTLMFYEREGLVERKQEFGEFAHAVDELALAVKGLLDVMDSPESDKESYTNAAGELAASVREETGDVPTFYWKKRPRGGKKRSLFFAKPKFVPALVRY